MKSRRLVGEFFQGRGFSQTSRSRFLSFEHLLLADSQRLRWFCPLNPRKRSHCELRGKEGCRFRNQVFPKRENRYRKVYWPYSWVSSAEGKDRYAVAMLNASGTNSMRSPYRLTCLPAYL